jgi:hypothetical protein
MCVARVPSPTGLEAVLRQRFGLDLDNSGNLRQIAAGRSLPFRKQSGPRIRDAVWPQRAQERWAGTIDWLITPFWYLAEHLADERMLIECVALLPAHFQEILLEDRDAADGGRPELASIPRSFVYELTVPHGPYALGALSCALRRARQVGDMGAERWCGVGLAWALHALELKAPALLRPLLAQLATTYLWSAAERSYSNGMCAPITSMEVEKFHREREVFLRWTVEEQLAAGERPAWMEE